AVAIPLVSGPKSGDTVTGLAEKYDNPNVGSEKTLSVSAYTVNDGIGGLNYAVTRVANNTGLIVWKFSASALKSPANLGSAVPVSWTLQDASGGYITGLNTLVTLENVFNGSAVPKSGCAASLNGIHQTLYSAPDGATGNSSFRIVSSGFQFNWDTTMAS